MAAERDGVYVTLERVTDKPRARSLGEPHLTPFKTHDFGTIFSYRLIDDEHINLREARAILYYLQWLLRAVGRRSRRVILLVDSKVAVGAMQKGRSGSPALNLLVRKAHCSCMAGGLRLHIVFIPTEHNPADYPSRGEAIPGRRHVSRAPARCPACGVQASDHPLDLPKKLRGLGHVCKGGSAGGYGYRNGEWVSEADIFVAKVREMDKSAPLRREFQ